MPPPTTATCALRAMILRISGHSATDDDSPVASGAILSDLRSLGFDRVLAGQFHLGSLVRGLAECERGRLALEALAEIRILGQAGLDVLPSHNAIFPRRKIPNAERAILIGVRRPERIRGAGRGLARTPQRHQDARDRLSPVVADDSRHVGG